VRIAVTGATGFIGSRLIARLSGAGHLVQALSRRALSPSPAIHVQPGSLEDSAALQALVRHANAVVHLAGAVRGARREEFDRTNVLGTAALLDAMDHAAPGTPLLVFSSLAAREPQLSHYAASKRAQEDLARARCVARPCTILRPPAVYGPGDREMLPVFRFMARTGLAPCAGTRSARVSLVFVDDLVEAVLAWLGRRDTGTEPLELHDGTQGGYAWTDLATIVGAACNRRVRVWEIPQPLLDAAAAANVGWSRLRGAAPMLSPGKLRELRHPDWVCDNTAVRARLGWEPRIALAEGLRLTPGWMD
jgi:nucleoside-diphosphate-sugar epimerase